MTNDAKSFQDVFSRERATIGKPDVGEPLTGLAFSGGGIRSATFNLGIIQSLAKHGLLARFDYLSTVSGGGYIGSWLSAQVHRQAVNGAADNKARTHKVEAFQKAFQVSHEAGAELDSVKWLRSYSNYLAPRRGLSGDALAIAGTWLRNAFLNQTTLFLFFGSLLLLPQVLLLTFGDLGWLSGQYSNRWLLTTVAFAGWAIVLCATNLPKARRCNNNRRGDEPRRQPTSLIIFTTVCAAYSLSLWVYSTAQWQASAETLSIGAQISMLKSLIHDAPLIADSEDAWPLLTIIQIYWSPIFTAGLWAIIYVLPWMFVVARSSLRQGLQSGAEVPPPRKGLGVYTVITAVAAGLFGGYLIYLLCHTVAQQSDAARLWWAVGFGTPALLGIFCLILVLHQGLMARLFQVSQLEWWARMGGYIMFVAASWALVHILLIYTPPLLDMLNSEFIAAGGLAWAAHSFAGVILGKSASTSKAGSTQWKERVTRAAPYVFVLGYLAATSWAVHALMYGLSTGAAPSHLNLVVPRGQETPAFGEFLAHALEIKNNTNITALWYTLIAASLAFHILAWRLDVNLFSIHHFYRNRLTRCYLGAGRGEKRAPNSFTGFDPCDDIRLADLKQRPLHLVNTALNLVHDDNLAWQDRKAYSFTLSPVACGFEYPPNAPQQGGGYCDSAIYMGGARLGTAMATSGAAASPNMGYHSSPAVAFLLTVFNVRLGHWSPNPKARAARGNSLMRGSPAMGGEYLLKELLGETDDRSAFVYLSDGGHFENLGVYELVRRRCDYILVVDAGQDEHRTFEDVANMIRKCYIDFGVRIDIKLDDLRAAPGGNSKGCYALGDIIYPKSAGRESVDQTKNNAILLYIKPSLLEGVPEDIRQYAKTNPSFPHQTTGDQFFDEAQFESYRHLGAYLMDEVMKSLSQQRAPSGKAWSWRRA